MFAEMGVPFAPVAAVLVTILEVGGGAALALGWQTRRIALALAVLVIPATLMFHSF